MNTAPGLRQRSYHQSVLADWQRCPRQVWFSDVLGLAGDPLSAGFAAPLGTAGHAGVRQVLADPAASADAVLATMLAAFDAALARGQEQGRVYGPDQVGGAMAKLETEYLDLVLRLGADERVRKVRWTHLEHKFAWFDDHGRRHAGRIDGVGVARERIPSFGRRDGEPADVEAGEWLLVDWKFGRTLDLTPLALSLNQQLAFYAFAAARIFPGHQLRAFVGALRDLGPNLRPTSADGSTIPKTLEELNPAYVEAFADGRPIDDELRDEAERSLRRFKDAQGNPLPKRLRRANPLWEERAAEPRGPLFHEARIAWSVVRPAIRQTIREIERAMADGGEEAFPARGPATQACPTCPFRARCARGA